MRELIIRRIAELFQREPPNIQSMRWQSFWYDAQFNCVGKSTYKEVAKNNLQHVSQIDWNLVPDEILLKEFEHIVTQVYRQFG